MKTFSNEIFDFKTMFFLSSLLFILFQCPSFVFNQNFFDIHLAPTTLTSVPYLNGEMTVYQHRNQTGRFFVPPLAIVQLNETKILFNQLTNRYAVRLALVLFTDELYKTVRNYLQKHHQLCNDETSCEIKMIPIDRLRIVWKRTQALSARYDLDSSWVSNTILLSAIYFNIGCSSETLCTALANDIVRDPEIIDGLELEYSTPAERHTRRDVTVMGSHVMSTNMFSSLKQMPSSDMENTRYLLADDLNHLISEVLSNVEMSDVTDAGYVSYDDQALLRDMLKNRIATNQEVLNGHRARQWDSVYWNPDNVRPDRTVKFLNEYLDKHETADSNQKLIDDYRKNDHSNDTAKANSTKSFDNNSRQGISIGGGSSSNYSDTSAGGIKHTDSSSSNSQDTISSSSSRDSGSNYNQNSGSSHYASTGGSSGSSGFLFGLIGGSRGSSNSNSGGNSHNNIVSNWNSNSRSNYDRNAQSSSHRDMNFDANNQQNIDGRFASNFNAKDNSTTDIRGRDDAEAEHRKFAAMDEFARRNFDADARKQYNENRQYLEFNGERFETKSITAYRTNIGMFNEKLRLISKSVVVQRIDAIHAVPIRALAEPYVLSPLAERYKINVDQRILELQSSLLNSINETFLNYKTEAQRVLDQTLLSTTRIINNALVASNSNVSMDTDLRYLIKKSLAQTMALKDIGLFDNAILDYYRYAAEPIEKITVVSTLPLKIALHFPQVSIEGMVCDNQFSRNDAKVLCSIYNKKNGNVNHRTGVAFNRTAPGCVFKTNFIHETVPCPYLISRFNCKDNSLTLKECDYRRISSSTMNICQNEGHVNLFC